MPRYIDADKLLQYIGATERCDDCSYYENDIECRSHSLSRQDICTIGEDLVEESADVCEVIPCGDCIYAKPYNKKWRLPIIENLLWCEHHNEEKEPNWFCADAIERTVKK